MYFLHAAALSKPGAVEHLTTDLANCGSDVAVVTETHFKSKHADSAIAMMATQYSREIVLDNEVAEWPSMLGLVYRQLFGSTYKMIVLLN